MVTRDATPKGVEATPTTTDSTPEAVGDQPLIQPEEFDDSDEMDRPLLTELPEGEVSDEEEGEATTAEEGEAETSEVEETEESQPESEAEKGPSEEVRKIQQGFDRQIADLKREQQELRDAAARREQELQTQLEQRQYQAQVQGVQAELQRRAMEQGYDERTAAQVAQDQTRYMQTAFEAEQRAQRLQAELDRARQSGETANSREAARRLAEDHGVPSDDIPLLLNTRSPQEMEALAQRLGSLNKRVSEFREQRRSEIPDEQPPLDSGGGDGGGMSDRQKWTAYGRGDIDLSPSESARLERKFLGS